MGSKNRYFQWCLFRLVCLARTWKGKSILSLALLFLFAAQAGIQVISSPQALGHVMEKFRTHDHIQPTQGEKQGGLASESFFPQIKDPLAASPLEDLRQALADYGKMPDWLSSLENTRMSPPGVKVRISHPHLLTERQRRLMGVQGMVLSSWTKPGQDDRLTATPQYWVQWNDSSSSWTIHARPLDLSTSGDGPGAVVVLRSILWIDALDALEQWEAENPAPVPPASLHPGGVSTALLPSVAGNTMMAICATWILALALMSLWSVIQMSSWGALRASGGWVAFAGLTHDTHKLLWAQTLLIGFVVLLASLFAGMLSWLLMASQGLEVSASWVWKTSIVFCLAIVLSHVVSTALQIWPATREARQVLGGILALVFAAINLWVAGFWYNMRPLAAFFSSYGLPATILFCALVSLILLRLCAWKMDTRARCGYLSS